jgi:rhomboid protease GluP
MDQVEQESAPRPARVSLAIPLGRPLVTWVLLGIIVAVFTAETLLGGSTETEVLIRLGAKVTYLIADGEYWRLLSSMFLHVGLLHLLFNGYALVALGTAVERLFGWGRFLAVYLAAGLFGSLASYAFSTGLSAGASGAVFGLIGALGAYFFLHRQQLGSWGQRRLANVVFLGGANLLFGFTLQGIDNLAHLGGLLGGLGLGWALAPRYQVDLPALRLTDRNHLKQYWPALALATALFAGGAYLATVGQRNGADYYLSRGQDALEREAWAEAATQLEQVVARYPDEATASAYFYLGLARNNLDQPYRAAEAYESALKLVPNDSSTRWNLALTYAELARQEEACLQFNAYLSLNPEDLNIVQPYLNALRCSTP